MTDAVAMEGLRVPTTLEAALSTGRTVTSAETVEVIRTVATKVRCAGGLRGGVFG
ncbi:MAG: hypothetical protein QM676_10605 [Novosphingobium sp.]